MTTRSRPPPIHDATNQRICSQLVAREVGDCASYLIYHLARHPEALEGSDYSWDEDLLPLCTQDDWQTPWEESGAAILEDSIGGTYAVEERYLDEIEKASVLGREELIHQVGQPVEAEWNDELGMLSPTDFRDACEAVGIDDPRSIEAYEHWIVSDWFGKKLAAQGEMVGELFGLTIWGRPTTGQAISLDGVIVSIANEMEILVGQAYEWTV